MIKCVSSTSKGMVINMKKGALALLSISFVILGVVIGFATSSHKHGCCKCDCCCDTGNDETSVSDDDFVK